MGRPILELTTSTELGLSFLFHDVVLLRYIKPDSELRRAVSVLKMRDSDHEKGLRQFVIDNRGPTAECLSVSARAANPGNASHGR